jgi:hypothetical protein
MAAGDLTDLATVRIAAGIASSSTDTDAILGALITAISAFIPQYLEQGILSAQYAENYEGNGKSQILLRQRPVISISSIAWNGQTITAAGNPISGQSGAWTDGRNACLEGFCFPRGLPIQIVYQAGYAAAPADLSYACAELVAEEYARRERVGENSRSQGGQVTVSFDQKAMGAAIAIKLGNYRIGAPC